MAKRLFERIADELLARIRSTPDYVIPPVRELTSEWRVSNITMGKAVHLLADQGVLSCVQGKRISLRAATRPAVPRISASEQKLLDEIRHGIMDGTYRPGEPLPKISFFALTHHVATDTVTRVLSSLKQEGLIHKRGRKWIPGRDPQALRPAASVLSRSPVVVMVARDEYAWIEYYNSTHTRPFSVAFNSEISRSSVRMELCLTEPPPQESALTHQGTAYASPDDLIAQVRSLGDRYAGAFFVCQADSVQRVLPWMSALCRLGKPVLYFDATGGAGEEMDPLMQRFGNLYHLCMDEQGAVKLAVDALSGCGHAAICIPNIERRQVRWVQHRIDLVTRYAASRTPPVAVSSAPVGNALWNMEHPDSIHYFVTAVAGEDAGKGRESGGIRGIGTRRRRVLEMAPEFVEFLRENKPTAIIALNDFFARQLYYWLKVVGIEVPGHVSIVSFDNVPESITFPIATIDLGFTALGFQAAHLLIDDLPHLTRISRRVEAVPRLLDRGSIAPPRGIPPHLLTI